MAQNFVGCDRDQVLLLPPDLREWLPSGHLARFVIETVDRLDLTALYGYYRRDGHGRPAHDPSMMVALVLYAYSVGVTSSRAIERRCVDDVAFRVISADRQPDHSTIARFLVRHREPLQDLFFQVLALCRRAGMVRVGTVAVDSTKLAASASAAQNRTLEGLEAEARRIIEEAIETDAREDELYGERRGDELPEDLADPGTRGQRIKELLEEVRREQVAAAAERDEQIAAHQPDALTGKRPAGRPPKPEGGRRQRTLFAKKYNLTDPDSGIVRSRGGFLQGYNVQTVVAGGQVILATSVSGVSADQGQLAPMINQAKENLDRIGGARSVGEVLADSGYWKLSDVRELTAAGHDVLVPPATPARVAPEAVAMLERLDTDAGKRSYQYRQHMIEPVFGQIKHNRGIRRLLRRGKAAVQAEIDLIATTHNLLKLRTALQTG
jgi:transposase